MKTTRLKRIVRITGLLTLALSFSACGSEKDTSPEKATARPIKLITLESATGATSNSYPAVIEAATSRQLSFQVSGQLIELPVKEAQQVKAGDILAKLEQEDYQNQFDAAKAQFETANTEYQRAVRLFDQDAISKSILEQRKSQRDVSETQFKSAEKALNETTLFAPFDGAIAKIDASKLDTIQAGAAIITLLGQDGMQATANVPATLVTTVNQRKDKRAMVILDAAADKPIAAEFKEVALEADSSTQTFALTFTFQPPEELVVLPRMNATLVLSAMSVDDAAVGVMVPIAAINSDGAGQYVWVVDPETMKVSRRNISIENGVGETAQVIEGLASGETIAGAGGSYLAEGMLVRPWIAE